MTKSKTSKASAARPVNESPLHFVVMRRWYENERATADEFGASGRPDGASLHIDEEHHRAYVHREWDRRDQSSSAPTPDCYSYPTEEGAENINVGESTYKVMLKRGGDLRICASALYNLKQNPHADLGYK